MRRSTRRRTRERSSSRCRRSIARTTRGGGTARSARRPGRIASRSSWASFGQAGASGEPLARLLRVGLAGHLLQLRLAHVGLGLLAFALALQLGAHEAPLLLRPGRHGYLSRTLSALRSIFVFSLLVRLPSWSCWDARAF